MTQETLYWVQRDQAVLGRYSPEQLMAAAKSGKLLASDKIKKLTGDVWMRADAVPLLVQTFRKRAEDAIENRRYFESFHAQVEPNAVSESVEWGEQEKALLYAALSVTFVTGPSIALLIYSIVQGGSRSHSISVIFLCFSLFLSASVAFLKDSIPRKLFATLAILFFSIFLVLSPMCYLNATSEPKAYPAFEQGLDWIFSALNQKGPNEDPRVLSRICLIPTAICAGVAGAILFALLLLFIVVISSMPVTVTTGFDLNNDGQKDIFFSHHLNNSRSSGDWFSDDIFWGSLVVGFLFGFIGLIAFHLVSVERVG